MDIWTDKDEEEHKAIVDQLRRVGWDRLDALEEADLLMKERLERRKKQGIK